MAAARAPASSHVFGQLTELHVTGMTPIVGRITGFLDDGDVDALRATASHLLRHLRLRRAIALTADRIDGLPGDDEFLGYSFVKWRGALRRIRVPALRMALADCPSLTEGGGSLRRGWWSPSPPWSRPPGVRPLL